MRSVGILTSLSTTLDAFFPRFVEFWVQAGIQVHTAGRGLIEECKPTTHTNIGDLSQKPNLSSLQGARRSISMWMQTVSPDVVVTNTATASALVRLVRSPTPLVYLCHGLHWNRYPLTPTELFAYGVERKLVSKVEGVIVMNDADETFFLGLHPEKVTRLKYGVGVNPEDWKSCRSQRRAALELMWHQPTILWAGSFTKRKRPADAVQLIHLLHLRGIQARLLMAGDGPLKASTQKLVYKYGLADFVEFPGHTKLQPLFSGSDLLLHTSAWEGYCRVLLEARFAGLPAIGYRTKGVSDNPHVICNSKVGDVSCLALDVLALFNKTKNGTPQKPVVTDFESKASDYAAWSQINRVCEEVVKKGNLL